MLIFCIILLEYTEQYNCSQILTIKNCVHIEIKNIKWSRLEFLL